MKSTPDQFVGIRIQEEFEKLLCGVERLLAGIDFMLPILNRLRGFKDGAVRPFTVAVFGWMKTGKSSLINALLNKRLAITGVNETTATLNVISKAPSLEMCDRFTVYWNDAPPESFDLCRLESDWTGTKQDVLDRVAKVKRLQLYSDAPLLGVHEIIDTPGIGTTATGHEEAAHRVIEANESGCETSDALVYVFGPNVREKDMEKLSVYAKSSMQNGNAYNSIGILHLWDTVYFNNGGNYDGIIKLADKAYGYSKGFVSKVLPVSAPLAFAAQSAPEEMFVDIVSMCKKYGEKDVLGWLKVEQIWDRESARQSLRRLWSLPWVSFKIIVREGLSSGSAEQLRKRILDLSGISQLRALLDSQIFMRSAVIRQRQQYAGLYRIGQDALREVRCMVEGLSKKCDNLEEIKSVQGLSSRTRQWVNAELMSAKTCVDDLSSRQMQLERLLVANDISKRILDMDAMQWYRDSGVCEDEKYAILIKVFDATMNYRKVELNIEEFDILNSFVSNELPMMKAGFRGDLRACRLLDHLFDRLGRVIGG